MSFIINKSCYSICCLCIEAKSGNIFVNFPKMRKKTHTVFPAHYITVMKFKTPDCKTSDSVLKDFFILPRKISFQIIMSFLPEVGIWCNQKHGQHYKTASPCLWFYCRERRCIENFFIFNYSENGMILYWYFRYKQSYRHTTSKSMVKTLFQKGCIVSEKSVQSIHCLVNSQNGCLHCNSL